MLSDVYYPTIDNTNVETLQYVVTDGSTFTDLQARDMTYTVEAVNDTGGMACEVTATAKSGKYSIVTDYITDPARNSVLMQVELKPQAQAAAEGSPTLRLYVRFDPTVNGNGGGGAGNGGADSADRRHLDRPSRPRRRRTRTRRRTPPTATTRSRSTPRSTARSPRRRAGFAGTASDGLTAARRLARADADLRATRRTATSSRRRGSR